MDKLFRIYKDNINGIIATMVIHLIILITMLFYQLKNNMVLPADSLFVDFLPEEQVRPPEEEKSPGSDNNQTMFQNGEHHSNRAVNLGNPSAGTSGDPFFDREYAKEVAEAKQLASDVKQNLEKKIPEIGDIPMPVASTEGMTPEEAKRSTFKGQSNIHYKLGNRYHIQLPIPVYLDKNGGDVTVDIVVNKSGEVVAAFPRNNGDAEMTLLAYAKQAAEKTRFNADEKAPDRMNGTISYHFLAQ